MSDISAPPIMSPKTYPLPLSHRYSPSVETTPRIMLKRKLSQSTGEELRSPRLKERPTQGTDN